MPLTPKISAALIVRNEEETIARCLSSIRNYVDEIVIVDTGSTDRTKEVVRRFTDRIFDFAWCDDFGKARQYAFDQATGDWVFWLDADDIVVGAEYLRDEVTAMKPEETSILWKYVMVNNGVSALEFWRERCVRNNGSFRWAGRVHEVLVSDRPDKQVYSQRIFVEHHQVHQPTRTRRNLNIMEAEFADLGEATPARTLFYLGNEYSDYREWERAAEIYRLYLQKGTWRDERYFATIRLGRALSNLKRYDEAIDTYLNALKERPQFPHAYFGLAEAYYYQESWDRVAHWAEIGEQMAAPETILFLRKTEWEYDWIIHYTNALYHLGRLQDALRWTEYALTIQPNDKFHQSNRAFFLSRIDRVIWDQLNTG